MQRQTQVPMMPAVRTIRPPVTKDIHHEAEIPVLGKAQSVLTMKPSVHPGILPVDLAITKAQQ